MRFHRKKLIAAITINILIVLMEVASMIMGFVLRWDEYKFKALLFYTQDSNLFAMFACGVMAASQAKCLCGKLDAPSKTAQHMKYMAACSLSLTFLVVLFVLIPLAGLSSFADKLFTDAKLYHHFLCPVLTAVSFLWLEDYRDLTAKDAGFALIPTACYAVILTALNILRIADGPYPFLRVYNQPIYMSVIWGFIILGSAYAIARGLLAFNHKAMKGATK